MDDQNLMGRFRIIYALKEVLLSYRCLIKEEAVAILVVLSDVACLQPAVFDRLVGHFGPFVATDLHVAHQTRLGPTSGALLIPCLSV